MTLFGRVEDPRVKIEVCHRVCKIILVVQHLRLKLIACLVLPKALVIFQDVAVSLSFWEI